MPEQNVLSVFLVFDYEVECKSDSVMSALAAVQKALSISEWHWCTNEAKQHQIK